METTDRNAPQQGKSFQRTGLAVLVMLFIVGGSFWLGSWIYFKSKAGLAVSEPPQKFLFGEFDPSREVIVSWPKDLTQIPPIVQLSALASQSNMKVIVLTHSPDEKTIVRNKFTTAGIEQSDWKTWIIPKHCESIRDFAPLVVKSSDGLFDLVTTQTSASGCQKALVDQFDSEYDYRKITYVPIGSSQILSNGAGLILTTSKAFSSINDGVNKQLGATQVVNLESLQGDVSQNINLFLTFISSDIVVVGNIDPDADPVNSRILNLNAERLANTTTQSGPLRVVRIPMPARNSNQWPSYTTVVFLNRRLVVPSYSFVDSKTEEQALETYRKLLAGWNILEFESDDLLNKGKSIQDMAVPLHQSTVLP